MKKRTLANIYNHTLRLMYIIAGILLIFSMLIISIGVASRYLFNRPMAWVIEIVEFSLLYIGFLVAPWVLKKGGHVKMDLVFDALSPKIQYGLNIITSSISTIICLILAYFGLRVTWDLFRTGYTTPTVLELPKFIFTAIIFIGSAILFLQFLIKTLEFLSSKRLPISEKKGH